MGSSPRPGRLASWVVAFLPRCAAIPFTASGRACRRRPSGALRRAPATGANWLLVLAGRGGRGPPGVTDRPTGTHRAVRAGRRRSHSPRVSRGRRRVPLSRSLRPGRARSVRGWPTSPSPGQETYRRGPPAGQGSGVVIGQRARGRCSAGMWLIQERPPGAVVRAWCPKRSEEDVLWVRVAATARHGETGSGMPGGSGCAGCCRVMVR